MGNQQWIGRLLVANRGEIARRIFRTCRELGVETVAVYSDPDADALFVREADLAVPLGGASPAESYLRQDAIVAAATRAGADAIHPGYGFLSENAAFARLCEENGLRFVGPSVRAIDVMGSKLAARDVMEAAGIPVLPGVDLTGLSEDAMLAAAAEIGFPVLVKASAGGGGRGMRIVHEASQFHDAVVSARREAVAAFGDGTLFVERYVERPRHVEIQVLGDTHGTVVHVYERECSIQRRHQKILEESPSPAVDEALRRKMGEAAVTAAEAIDYVGAGTVEFILAPSGDFYFLEMNTRLQVEHPVTESITGLDLVRLQLLVAQGEPLPVEAFDPPISGHAIEARLYAEDVEAGFLPSAGMLHQFEIPEVAGIRVDTGVETGSTVDINYDPMVAKVIAHAPTRGEAIRKLASTLRRSRVHGIVSNRELLIATLEHPEFVAGTVDTHFLQRHPPTELMASTRSERGPHLSALAAALAQQARNVRDRPTQRELPSGWRNNPSQMQVQTYEIDATAIRVAYQLGRDARYEIDGSPLDDVELLAVSVDAVSLLVDGVRHGFDVHVAGDVVYVDSPGGGYTLRWIPRLPAPDAELAAGSLTAPMPGSVVSVDVVDGDSVEEGQALVVIEAMKMEHVIAAPGRGRVKEVRAELSQVVSAGDVLVVLEEEESP